MSTGFRHQHAALLAVEKYIAFGMVRHAGEPYGTARVVDPAKVGRGSFVKRRQEWSNHWVKLSSLHNSVTLLGLIFFR